MTAKALLLLLLTMFIPNSLLADVTIYDIQYTTVAGDGTYPSLLDGQTVTTGGIVSAVDYSNGRYFISGSGGGAWNGIYIYDNTQNPALGDSVHFQGRVDEYYGFTELKNIANFTVVSSDNPLPPPAQISCHSAAHSEAYESVFVEVNNVGVSQTYDSYEEWRINDGSGDLIVGNGIFNLADLDVSLMTAYPFSAVRGVISYSWGEFRLHPRDISDIISMPGAFLISAGSAEAYDLSEIELPITLGLLGADTEVLSFEFVLFYNPNIIQYTGFSQSGTISEVGAIIDNSSSDRVSLSFTGQGAFSNIGTLINLHFIPTAAGNATLTINSAAVNGTAILYRTHGDISTFISETAIGDTLTVIQRPILNIPAIITPGETLDVLCLAPEMTTGWTASLQHGDSQLELPLTDAHYDQSLARWFLEFSIPQPPYFELFDLKVTASGLNDVTSNAVHLIPERKSTYNFVHITDIHLPTNLYYDDPQSLEDSSSIEDLRAIIEDVNLLHPEFVLITGDLVNEGELEDFQGRRYYTKAQRVLGELEVPFYLVAGNHDLGGWDDTPPPQGTARRNWWRFFGWPWLNAPPPSEQVFTQDYSFDYGPIHYVGLEAYDNYDGFRWDTYGSQSFTAEQLQWLDEDLANASQSQSQVLFYHYDFSEDLDLSALEVEMALWGHTHRDTGDIHSIPYDLASGTTSHGNRTYRIIRVEDDILRPEEVIYANWPDTDRLTITFDPDNEGSADSVTATINNLHGLSFDDARIKFQMPAGDHSYTVHNGVLEQVVRTGEIDICYVSADLLASAAKTITMKVDTSSSRVDAALPTSWVLHQNFPNPFNPYTQIRFELGKSSQINLSIFDLKGRVVRELIEGPMSTGKHQVLWNGLNDQGSQIESGIYFYTMESESFKQTRKMTLLR